MKKILKFLGITLVVIIALLVAIPLLFSDQIEDFVKKEINSMVNAKVDYDDFSLSIFSSFPDLRAGLDGVSVVGNDKFEGDTLAYIGNFSADVDIMSVFSGEYAVNAVILNNLKAKGIVTSDSIANWDIMISNDTTAVEEEEVVDTTSTPLKLNLDKVAINHAYLTYIDSTSNMEAHINDLCLDLNGKMNGDLTNLKLALDIAGIDFATDNINMLKKATVDFDADIEADLANNKYTFKENSLNFSGVPLAFDGYVQLNDKSTTVDMKLGAKETSFKTILALVPSYIMKDVAGLKADGSLELYAKVNGEYIDMEHIPALDVIFKVNNGLIKYPDLPKSLNDINIDVVAKNPGGSADLTTVNINKFHFELGNNPFDATLNLVTPISNATFNAGLNGTIDLNSLKEALPLDSMTIGGIIKANVNVASDMKAIEQEKYEEIKAEGAVELSQFNFTSNDLPQGVNISNAKLAFSPKALELNPLNVTLGKSDFDVTGKVEQYLAYLLNDGTIKGVVTLKSNVIDCNELMGESTTTTTETASVESLPDSTATVGAVEIPKNIDFTFTPAISKLYYDNLVIENINGKIAVKDGIALLNNVKMNLCQGVVSLNGKYNSQNINDPSIDMGINLNNVDINDLTNSFSTIDSLLPIAKSAHGKVTIGLDIDSKLDQEMSPILKTLNGRGDFASQDIQLKESDFQNKLAKLLNNDKYSEMNVKNCKFDFTIENGSIIVNPFNFNMFNKQTTFSGKQGLDKTMDYVMSIPVARAEAIKLLGSTIGSKIDANGADIPVGISIGGLLTSPKLGLNLDDAKKMIGESVKAVVEEKVEEVKEQVKEKVEEKVEEVKEQVKEKVEEKVSEELKNNEQVQEAKDKAKDALKGLFKKK